MELILASGSPRRRALLEQIGLRDFTVLPADVDETIAPGTPPHQAVMELSKRKAEAVAASHPDALILAADTVVAFDGHILGKPHSAREAEEMLRALSDRVHEVHTGFTLRRGDQIETGQETTQVSFRALTDSEIKAYVATGEPMDKAGAYGIQGLGALLVRGIRGDYFNVMGLPLCRVGTALKNFGLELWTGGKGDGA